MSGRKFLNPVATVLTPPGSMLRMMRRVITEKRIGDPKSAIGPFHTDAQVYALPAASGLRVTWMGHSSLLIEIDGHRILTDPAWSERASLVSFAGPKRFYAPTLALEDLPPLDAILLSHDHYDHLDPRDDSATALHAGCRIAVYLRNWRGEASGILGREPGADHGIELGSDHLGFFCRPQSAFARTSLQRVSRGEFSFWRLHDYGDPGATLLRAWTVVA